jgi:hypothetical protein
MTTTQSIETFQQGDRVEWHQPGQLPFSFNGTIYGPHPTWPNWWIVAWVSSDGRRYDARVHRDHLRKAVS